MAVPAALASRVLQVGKRWKAVTAKVGTSDTRVASAAKQKVGTSDTSVAGVAKQKVGTSDTSVAGAAKQKVSTSAATEKVSTSDTSVTGAASRRAEQRIAVTGRSDFRNDRANDPFAESFKVKDALESLCPECQSSGSASKSKSLTLYFS